MTLAQAKDSIERINYYILFRAKKESFLKIEIPFVGILII